MRRTPLYEIHKSLGATFDESDGWEIPERFGEPLEEYRAVRSRVGIFDRSFRGKLLLTGSDRVRFLQGMVTNDVKGLKEGEGCYAAMLTPQGKVLTDLSVYVLPDAFLIDVGAARKEVFKETLEKYIIADDVRVKDVTESYGLLSVQGPEAPKLLAELFGGPMEGLEEFQYVERTIRDLPVRLIRRTWYTQEEGYELLTPWDATAQVWEALWEKGRASGLQPVGITAFEILRVEAGHLRVGVDMDETTLSLEAGLHRAISLTKGCYIGQEYVARITYRGHVNRRLVGMKILGEIVPRCREKVLVGEKEVGWVTSAVFSPHFGCPIALGYVRREHAEPGSQLQIAAEGALIPAEVVPLPFYRRVFETKTQDSPPSPQNPLGGDGPWLNRRRS